uniref:MATH domain-containing protein n=1 Tax=Aegilops tauschii subsp. strangulata TaxID=200361 RepID=A0A452YFC9_AEGTS
PLPSGVCSRLRQTGLFYSSQQRARADHSSQGGEDTTWAPKGEGFDEAPAPLGKTHDPCFKWKIHDFSVLLERGAIPTNSALFHSFGHKWFLRVTPSHTKSFAVAPYVALSLGLSVGSLDLEPDYTVEAMFVLAIYNHSNGLNYGSEASYMFHINNTNSMLEHLIPLKELLKSPGFLAGDCCVFGVEILKVDVFPHEKEAVVVQKKAPTVQNLFIQKNGFVTRNCT